MSVYIFKIMVRGMNLGKISRSTSILVCKVCTEHKQYGAKLGNDAKRQATTPLKIARSGVYSFMRNVSIGVTKYFVTFFDDF